MKVVFIFVLGLVINTTSMPVTTDQEPGLPKRLELLEKHQGNMLNTIEQMMGQNHSSGAIPAEFSFPAIIERIARLESVHQSQVNRPRGSNEDLVEHLKMANEKVKHLQKEYEELIWQLEEAKIEVPNRKCNPEFPDNPNAYPEVHVKDTNGMTSLHRTAMNGTVDEVCELLEKGADTSVEMNEGLTPFEIAAGFNPNIEVTRLLLQRGAHPNATKKDGWTVLHLAAARNPNPEVIRLLLHKGADPNAKNYYDSTPLHEAAIHNANAEVIRLLLQKGADLNAKQIREVTALHLAVYNNQNVEVTSLLLQKGSDPNAKNDEGYTPLHRASIKNPNVEVIHQLLQKGADPNAKTISGETPLLLAAKSNPNVEVTRLLLQKGADLNATNDNDGQTPLHRAVIHKQNIEVIRLLLQKGADANAKEGRGLVPLFFASDSAVESLLKEYGATD